MMPTTSTTIWLPHLSPPNISKSCPSYIHSTSAFKGKGKVKPIKSSWSLTHRCLLEAGKLLRNWQFWHGYNRNSLLCVIWQLRNVSSFMQRKCAGNKAFKKSANFDLSSLQPRLDYLEQHVKRANYQVVIWIGYRHTFQNLQSRTQRESRVDLSGWCDTTIVDLRWRDTETASRYSGFHSWKHRRQAGRRLVSAPSPNVAMSTRVGPTYMQVFVCTDCPTLPWHTSIYTMTDSMTHSANFGDKFWALGGVNQKSKNNVL